MEKLKTITIADNEEFLRQVSKPVIFLIFFTFEYFWYLTFINIWDPNVIKSARYVRPYITK